MMGKSHSDFREMDENPFFHEGALFRTYFYHLRFHAPCFRKAISTDCVFFKGDWTTLQRRGSTEPNSLRYDPSKLARNLGSGFAQIIPSWEFLELMSEYLGLLSVNINLERCVSFSDRYRSSSDSFMGKSYSDFREMDEICFFSRALFFALFLHHFCYFSPCVSE